MYRVILTGGVATLLGGLALAQGIGPVPAPRSQVAGKVGAPTPPAATLRQDVQDQVPNLQGVTDGRAIYLAGCATCHGEDLTGNNAQSMVDGEWQFGRRRGQIRRNIANGIEVAGMPAYGEALTDEQLNAVTDYVLSVEQRAAPERRDLPTTVETADYTVEVTEWVGGFEEPWAVVFLSEDEALVTEKQGTLRRVVDGTLQPRPVQGTPRVQVRGQGGLMDVNVDPDYGDNGWVYLSYSHPAHGDFGRGVPVMTRVVRGRIDDHNRWTDEQVIFEADPEHYRTAGAHFGNRIVFSGGYLFFGIGDRGAKEMAQDVTRPNGKIYRLYPDGSVPDDNPFVDHPDAYTGIYAYGNRNPQGLAVHPRTGAIWETEHGPLGGDELNLIRPGHNFGWPAISYGRNYNGTILTDEIAHEGMTQPVMYWNPSIAACGLTFYDGDLFKEWQNDLLAGALKYEDVRRIELEEDTVAREEIILKSFGRVRAIEVGPDGAIYVVTNTPGRILRLAPAD